MLQFTVMFSLSQIQHLILDMDGVLWLGNTPIPGLRSFFALLRQLDIQHVLATNNATATPAMYVDKLAHFGVDVDESQIITSATATASFLSQRYGPGTTVYVVGGAGIFEALRKEHFALINDGGDCSTPDLVVMGLDKDIDYEKLCLAALHVARGAHFIGTNPDPSYPSERGELPGAGALQAVITATTGIEPVNIGKPASVMFEEGLLRMKGTIVDTAMVGDRLTTDIDGAQAIGMPAILVRTGVTDNAVLAKSQTVPDYTFDDIVELGQALAKSRQAQETS